MRDTSPNIIRRPVWPWERCIKQWVLFFFQYAYTDEPSQCTSNIRLKYVKKKKIYMSKNKSDCRRQTSFSRVERTTIQRRIYYYVPSRGYSVETDMIDIPGFREI